MNNFIKTHLKVLYEKNFTDPVIELRALLNKTSFLKKEIILANFNINQINLNLFQPAFERRIKMEPLAKIFKEKEFWKYNFIVNENVLDPRPESELIIEAVEKCFQNKKENLKIIDIGTGSGCLAVSLALEYKNSMITATDISKSALDVAKKNSKKFNVCEQIKFKCCNWFETKENFDVIVTNPPYLTNNEYNNLSKEIKLHEPKIALRGGKDGLSCFREIAYKIQKITHFKSLCFVEIGYYQRDKCIKIFEEFDMYCIDIIVDYQNYERTLIFKRNIK
ncbi:MAG: peptide chain release factor N(5)-glutamine methyltransferase [Pelagibacteraceae bacterium]|jgi:release factor glutamine methyltransferase|nr:peptide chain release factor N(5)-glutamine methyltransferase [Pelagibacteraceae bacterium]HJO14406.1 peptide chain release factor N(5)-glutamine methyltransferase [Alphaproteobacteria bacterium]MBO6466983.1 peptide chain release factor N(5)-glutamine methyltransferase [Pelagibacteraceae bacterium]MBO6467987.1 peptide chain release factor N(5)-glutamine methyltransferase [Pelagibacteraceae bacterium]MBO6470198.1 peptide chain release factor N(5)-glutamine methyltransferase [Pelagibacteraceae|tara:strand:+ start:554 stop:1390 length:837 start_codon:yes stop_codon:yes gene_type:complete